MNSKDMQRVVVLTNCVLYLGGGAEEERDREYISGISLINYYHIKPILCKPT